MNQRSYQEVLDSAAADALHEPVNLWPEITARLERKSPMLTLRTRPIVALLLALLILLALSGVAYALGRMFGYIPGVGIVDQSAPLRILAEPVVAEREGLTVTISEVIADSNRTFVSYTIDGVIVPAMARATCGAFPSLQLPDGSALSTVSVDTGGPQGARVGAILKLEQSVTYSSIPTGVNKVTFTLPCILPEGTGPENWQIPLALSPAPEGYATPAVEIGATFVASNPTFVILPTPTTDMRIFTPEPPESLPATPTTVPNGSGLYLDKVIELPDSYILVGNFTDAGDLPGALEVNLDPYEDLPYMEDGSGEAVNFKAREDIQPETMSSGVRYWAFEIAKPVQGPLTITLDQINIAKFYAFEFHFDVGANPQTGQTWEFNVPVRLGSYGYVMDSVEMIENGYLFKYHSGTDVPEGTSLLFNLIGHTPEQNSSEVRNGATVVEYSEELIFSPPLPTGQLTVELTSMETVPLQGPWTLTWTPPSK
jgi:hypothetical protein